MRSRVGSAEFLAGLVDSKHPADLRTRGVAGTRPRSDFCCQLLHVGNAAVEALGDEDTDLDLNHVEPARVFGRVVKFEALQDPPRFLRMESFVEGGGSCSASNFTTRPNTRAGST